MQRNQIQVCHPDVEIHQLLIYGTTAAVFKQYLEAHNIHFIAWHPEYQLKQISKDSFDPVELIRNSGWEVKNMSGAFYWEDLTRKLVRQLSFSDN